MTRAGMLLIGGGVASASAAAELRQQGYKGPITLVTRELVAPYHRPPISKGMLHDSRVATQIYADSWWADNGVELRTRSAVIGLDTETKTARLANKEELVYDQALIATGAMVRRLAVDGSALSGIHYLRAPMNAENLAAELEHPREVVIVGGSFIAVEVAATLAAKGHKCTMVMLEEQCLGQSFGGTVAGYVDDLLRRRGIEMVCGAQVAAFEGEDRISGVRTADGRFIPADVAVVGVGATPDAKLARSAGLTIGASGGVACDARLATSAADVFAAGDVCEYDSEVHGRRVRIEHERHAQSQGVTAARNMLGSDQPHRELPYFWTDIGDWATLEYVGVSGRTDSEVLTGSLNDGSFTVWQFAGDQLTGALTSGRPADLDAARATVVDGAPLPAEVADARLAGSSA